MCFFKIKSGTENNEEDEHKNLCKKIWEVLKGDDNNGIKSENLKAFTAAIMKIMIGKEAVDSTECYGEFNGDGKFIITQKQMARIHNDLNVYYLNQSM